MHDQRPDQEFDLDTRLECMTVAESKIHSFGYRWSLVQKTSHLIRCWTWLVLTPWDVAFHASWLEYSLSLLYLRWLSHHTTKNCRSARYWGWLVMRRPDSHWSPLLTCTLAYSCTFWPLSIDFLHFFHRLGLKESQVQACPGKTTAHRTNFLCGIHHCDRILFCIPPRCICEYPMALLWVSHLSYFHYC